MNPLFQMTHGQGMGSQPGQEAGQGNQRPVDFNTAMGQLHADPAGVLKQAGFNVPQEYIGNSQQTVMHLIRSGQVGGPMMRMIGPILNRLGVR